MQAMACPQASKAANINADSLKIMELYCDIFVNQNKVSSVKRFLCTPLGVLATTQLIYDKIVHKYLWVYCIAIGG